MVRVRPTVTGNKPAEKLISRATITGNKRPGLLNVWPALIGITGWTCGCHGQQPLAAQGGDGDCLEFRDLAISEGRRTIIAVA